MYNPMDIVRNVINKTDALYTYDIIDNEIFIDNIKELKIEHNKEIINSYANIKPYEPLLDKIYGDYYSYNKDNYKKRWRDYYNSKSRDKKKILN